MHKQDTWILSKVTSLKVDRLNISDNITNTLQFFLIEQILIWLILSWLTPPKWKMKMKIEKWKKDDNEINSKNQVTVWTTASPSKDNILNLSITKCSHYNSNINNNTISPYILSKELSNPYKNNKSTKYPGNGTTSMMNRENNSIFRLYTKDDTLNSSNSTIKALQGKT